jgi:hypothetical protein
MPTRARVLTGVAAAAAAIVIFFAFARRADAYYEYQCGAHRNAMCHEEPRADELTSCYTNGCFGRCGPGCDWSALGNQYTGACESHDNCIRTQACSYNTTGWQAHANCAGGLPAAVGSWFQTHWNNGFQHAKDTWTGLWTKVKNCCN